MAPYSNNFSPQGSLTQAHDPSGQCTSLSPRPIKCPLTKLDSVTSNRTTSHSLSNYIASGRKELKKKKNLCMFASLRILFSLSISWVLFGSTNEIIEPFVKFTRPYHHPHSFYTSILTHQPRFLIVVNPPINSRTDNWEAQLKRTHHFNGKLSRHAAVSSRISSTSFVGWIRHHTSRVIPINADSPHVSPV